MARLMVAIENPAQLSQHERQALLDNCRLYNLSFYRLRQQLNGSTNCIGDEKTLLQLASQLGLQQPLSNPCADANHLSRIEVSRYGRYYIPYTNKALGWHTDGYYSSGKQTVRAFAMHCMRAAADGGDNFYFDPVVLLALLANENPHYPVALQHPQTFSIPANTQPGDERAGCEHAVFSFAADHTLCMRYTQRARNICWRDHGATQKALAFIEEVLNTPSRYRLRYKLQAGEGVISNNVLHNRSAFNDEPSNKRLLYRMRWHTRVGSDCNGEHNDAGTE